MLYVQLCTITFGHKSFIMFLQCHSIGLLLEQFQDSLYIGSIGSGKKLSISNRYMYMYRQSQPPKSLLKIET